LKNSFRKTDRQFFTHLIGCDLEQKKRALMRKTILFLSLFSTNMIFGQTINTWTGGYYHDFQEPIWLTSSNSNSNWSTTHGYGSCETVFRFNGSPGYSVLVNQDSNPYSGAYIPTTFQSLLIQNTNNSSTVFLTNDNIATLEICGSLGLGYTPGIQGNFNITGVPINILSPIALISGPFTFSSETLNIQNSETTLSGSITINSATLNIPSSNVDPTSNTDSFTASSSNLNLTNSRVALYNLQMNSSTLAIQENSTFSAQQSVATSTISSSTFTATDSSSFEHEIGSTSTSNFSGNIFNFSETSSGSFQCDTGGALNFSGNTLNLSNSSLFSFRGAGTLNMTPGNTFSLSGSSTLLLENSNTYAIPNNTIFNMSDSSLFVSSGSLSCSGKVAFNYTLTKASSPNNSPRALIQGQGCISNTSCQACSQSTQINQTYDLYLPTPGDSLDIAVLLQSANGFSQGASQNVQIMNFPNGFGSVTALSSDHGCCYNSGTMSAANGWPLGTVSIFDKTINQGSQLSLETDPGAGYHLLWSDVASSSFPGGFSSNGLDYGVNGVSALYVDIVVNPHPHLTSMAGQEATLNHTNLSTHLSSRRQEGFESSGNSIVSLVNDSGKEYFVVENSELFQGSDSFLAQLLEVEQLAEKASQKEIKPWAVYIEPKGSFGRTFQQLGHAGNSFQTAGTRAGFDYLWANQYSNIPLCIGVGLLGDYRFMWGQVSNDLGKFYSNQASGSVYATFVPKAIRELSVNLIGGGGYNWYTFHRDVFGNSSFVTTGDSTGPQYTAYLNTEYVFRHERFNKIPKHFRLATITALQYAYVKVNGYTETGAGRYNLKIDEQSSEVLSTFLGFRTNYEFIVNTNFSIRPEVSFQWQFQCLDPQITSTAIPLAAFESGAINSVLPGFPRNSLVFGANLRFKISDKATIRTDYDLLYNEGFITNAFFLELKGDF